MKKIGQKMFSVLMVMLMTLFNFLPYIPMTKVKAEGENTSINVPEFEVLDVGYEEIDYVSVPIVINDDFSMNPADLSAEITGEDAEDFEYTLNNNVGVLNGPGSWSNILKARPKTGLGEGVHRATLTLRFDGNGDGDYEMVIGSGELSFRVRDPETTYTLTVLTNVPSCQVEYDFTNYNSGKTYQLHEGESINLFARAVGDYQFVGTSSNNATVTQNGSIGRIVTMGYGDATVTFNFVSTTVTHNVTFETYGGSDVDEATVPEYGVVARPEDPTKEDKVFGGWYTDSTFTTEYDFNTQITEDTTIYAKWLNYVTLTFDVNGGNPMVDNTVVGVEGQTIMEIVGNADVEEPTHNNPRMLIAGLETELGEPLDLDAPVFEDLTIVIVWAEGHEVTFDSQVNNEPTVFETIYILDEDYAYRPEENPEWEGREFIGWYVDSTCTTPFDFEHTPITADTTIYGGWADPGVDYGQFAEIELGGNPTRISGAEGDESVTIDYEDGNAVRVYGQGLYSRESNGRYFVYGLGDITVEACPTQGYVGYLREDGNLLDGTVKNYQGLEQGDHKRIDGEFYQQGEEPGGGGPNYDEFEDIEFDITWTGTYINSHINGITIMEESQDFGLNTYSYEGVVVPHAGHTDSSEVNELHFQERFGDYPINAYTINGVTYEEGDEGVDIRDDGWHITVPGAEKYTITGAADTSQSPVRTIIWANVDADKTAENFDDDMLLEHGKAKVIAIYDENDQQVSGVVDVDAETGMGWVPVTPGYEVVFEFIPDYGYQLTAVSANGQELEPQSTLNQYRFTMPDTNIHFSATFTRVDDVVAANSNKVASGTIDLEGALNGGTGKLTVNDVTLSSDKINAFETEAGDYEISDYLDIDLYNIFYKGKNDANDVWESQIDELNKLVTITITLEDGVDGNDIVIVHNVHNGEQFEIIPIDSYDPETNTITFKTSSFSDFAIASRTVYEVTFETNGGTPVHSQTLSPGGRVATPEETTREGYQFGGWYTDDTLTTEFDFDTEINASTTIYAKWIPLYTVTYNLNGGVAGTNYQATQQVTEGTMLVATEPPASFVTAAQGYVYAGIEVNGMAYYKDSEVTIPISNNVTVKFLWNKLIKNVNLTLTPPTVGTETTTARDEEEGYWLWSQVTNRPVVSVESGAKYEIDETYWITGWTGDEYDTPYVGPFESGKQYKAEIALYANEGYQFADDVVVKVNGEVADYIMYNETYLYDDSESYMSVGKLVTPTEEESIYKIVEGADQTVYVKANKDLTVKANGDIDDLVSIKVDGQVVDSSNYTLTPGSTVVTLKSSYLSTLSNGTHTLTFVYNDGEVSTNFTINRTSNPQTGDDVMLYMAILLLGIVGLISSVKIYKKN